MDKTNNSEQQIQQEVPGMLPIEIIGGKKYFRDDRLREYRNVEDIFDVIAFDDYTFGSMLADYLFHRNAEVSVKKVKGTGYCCISIIPKIRPR